MRAMEPRNIHFSKRESGYGAYRPGVLCEGMTAKQAALTFGACLAAVLAAKGMLDAFAWCVGHFMKGWW